MNSTPSALSSPLVDRGRQETRAPFLQAPWRYQNGPENGGFRGHCRLGLGQRFNDTSALAWDHDGVVDPRVAVVSCRCATRRDCVGKFGINYGEFGWILEDNKGMLSIAELPSAKINHRYRIFEKAL